MGIQSPQDSDSTTTTTELHCREITRTANSHSSNDLAIHTLLLEGEETGPVGKLVVCDSVS